MTSSSNPAALIVGGSSGMGLEAARRFAARGLDVILVARDPDKLARARADLQGAGTGAVDTVAVDLNDTAAVEAFVSELGQERRHVMHLVNAAGVFFPKPFLEHEGA